MKQKFNIITSTCVPLPLENVDTDQIIPARFLKATDKKGFGENLFRDWRYDKQGNKIESFVLNDPTYGGQILVGDCRLWVSCSCVQFFCGYPQKQ